MNLGVDERRPFSFRQEPEAYQALRLACCAPFTLVCRGAIPIGSSLVVGFVHLAAESLRVSSRRRLGQILGQNRKLFRNREPAVSFLSRGQKRVGFEALKRPIRTPKQPTILFDTRLAK